ncbi:MAG: hypothetical protein IMW89_05660, partial [Ktedonobacteraceae bacterium]|nr:hypothetical protein [Ktedonobacteraceae bacterium]
QLFAITAGQATPLWERLLTIASVLLILAGLPFGLLCLWRRYRTNALAGMLGIFALAYPVSHVFRFTNAGSEISDRSAAFLFIAVSCILAVLIAQFWPVRRLSWRWMTLLTGALAVIFMGGTILGAGPPWEVLPGPYMVAADERSIEPQGIQAALWTRAHLGPDNPTATDRVNSLLMSTYGDQKMIISLTGETVPDIFLSPTLDAGEIAALRQAHVRYLVVDRRLAKALPAVGFYFELGEPGSDQRTRPADLAALTKFNTIPQISRVFDSGDIIIYDIGGLTGAP